LISSSKIWPYWLQKVHKTLKSIRVYQRKRFKITRMQDALTKKDSVTLALVTSLKKEQWPRYWNQCWKRSCIHFYCW
jgi:chemotaxis protein MotB